jgi:hypothetical protein
VKGQKAASGLEVGFRYATNSNMTGSKTVVAHFDEEHPEVFIGTIDTVKVATYYYQAYTKYEGEVHYGVVKSFGAQEVDLGLTSGIKWLNMNLGADHEEKAGDTYRWGETAPNQTGAYNVSADRTYIGGTAYDAAHTRLGKNYRLPSMANIQELLDECDWVWEVNGYRVKSRKNSNSIFLPLGSYWSSQQGAGTSSDATSLKLHDSNTKTPDALELRTDALMLRATRNSKADIEGEGGNAGGGEIGGGVEGDE